MRVTSARQGSRLVFSLRPSEEDLAYTENRKAKLASTDVFFECEDQHPDLYALGAALIAMAFTAKEIELDREVSPKFAEAAFAGLKRKVGPVGDVAPRPKGRRDALAFSGGIDSVAALGLMPKETVAVFLHRVTDPSERKGLYRADAALQSCAAVADEGREVVVAPSNLEHVRNPIGFPVDWSNAAAAVLMADQFDLRSVGFGMIAESAFHIGHPHFSELANRAIYRGWAPMFEAAGIPISLPTAGLSEVVTSKIAAQFARWKPQSCVRGEADKPCGRCFKCFRKTLLDSAHTQRAVSPGHFEDLSKEVKRRLLEKPIHHENVLAYSVHKMPSVDHPIFHALRELTAPLSEYSGLDFMERVYMPGLDYVPAAYRDDVATAISPFARPMTKRQMGTVQAWNLDPVVQDERYIRATATLAALLDAQE